MKWSLSLGRIAGIPIYLHASFALLLGWVAWIYWRASGSTQVVVSGLVFVIAVFGCVLLHELGHALAARRYGIRTRDITLLPIGGVARLERMPEKPAQELWVALAGPAVNLSIAVLLGISLLVSGNFFPAESLGLTSGSFTGRLLAVNLFLVLFNMVPAFPMDGGRVLRALLAMRFDYVRATRIAAVTGQAAATLFAVFGVLFNPFLLMIAFFVWIGASQEASMVRTRSELADVPVTSAMLTDYRTLEGSDPAGKAANLLLAGSQRDFPVLEEGRFIGLLTQRRLLELLTREGRSAPVVSALDEAAVTVDLAESLDVALERMGTAEVPMAVVVDNDRLYGVLTLENVVEYISVRDALDARPGGPRTSGPGWLDPRPGTAGS